MRAGVCGLSTTHAQGGGPSATPLGACEGGEAGCAVPPCVLRWGERTQTPVALDHTQGGGGLAKPYSDQIAVEEWRLSSCPKQQLQRTKRARVPVAFCIEPVC